jgi:hypothetical protein
VHKCFYSQGLRTVPGSTLTCNFPKWFIITIAVLTIVLLFSLDGPPASELPGIPMAYRIATRMASPMGPPPWEILGISMASPVAGSMARRVGPPTGSYQVFLWLILWFVVWLVVWPVLWVPALGVTRYSYG